MEITKGASSGGMIIGTEKDDVIISKDGTATINGHVGNDTIVTGDKDDLIGGDMVGDEWSFVDGKWVYNPELISTAPDVVRNYNDSISSGAGNDIILGNGGNDTLDSGDGDDLINAGIGHDKAYGGAGSDILNLENGNDLGVGGAGADIINAGAGNDIVYGDFVGDNLFKTTTDGSSPSSFKQYQNSDSGWEITDQDGMTSMAQTITTTAGEPYSLNFEFAANLAGGATSAKIEVLWNGEVVGEVTSTTGAFEKYSIDIPGTGEEGEVTFREVAPEISGPAINTDGPIASYEKTVEVGSESVDVAAFAPGQAKLYQVIDGQLKVFDTASEVYTDAGPSTGLKLNAIGFNVEDDLIYGIAKQGGVDSLGNPVAVSDLVMMDAEGQAYRIGHAPKADYVGDFDDSGNLWTFQSGLDRVTKIDVNNLDAAGNPVSQNFDLPKDLFNGRAYDIAFSAKDDCFYAVEAPSKQGGDGAVHKIDISGIEDGGAPQISSIPITGTLFDGAMESGMAKGAYGAVFLDGDGNLYYGMNRGDHDFDSSTGTTGGIYGVEMDWSAGTAYAKFMATSQATGSNDGAVDPRSADAFAPVDTDATVLIRNPEVVTLHGGDDKLRGGDGEDLIYGGGGDDIIHGGNDDDVLFGDHGNDRVFGGAGDDSLSGGEGDDVLSGGTGDDQISGGAGDDIIRTGNGNNMADGGAGDDRIFAGGGNDELSGGDGADFIIAGGGSDKVFGGAGADKLVGGAGADTIEGGAGNDHLWGGNWAADGAADTFVVSSGFGRDMIHDFEADSDVLDLSAYGLEFSDLSALMTDKGWATEIDLSGLTGGQAGDAIVLKAIDPDELDESNFIL